MRVVTLLYLPSRVGAAAKPPLTPLGLSELGLREFALAGVFGGIGGGVRSGGPARLSGAAAGGRAANADAELLGNGGGIGGGTMDVPEPVVVLTAVGDVAGGIGGGTLRVNAALLGDSGAALVTVC